ncbi:hypothetical protein [Aeromonas caviae]|uniref:hypothetical protein n=1 Tax=Aeromonas caviae TaxID=648 RepID=UPI002B498B1B|nr:hypothetical protein [Aeromonas caviae]
MDITEHYKSLAKTSFDVMVSMLNDAAVSANFIASHNHLEDFGRLKQAINNRPEVDTFDAGIKEYQFSLYALASGQYRHAFVGLRLSLELMLATIQFSAHEIDYRQWVKDSKDINWSALKDLQNGIFSVNFINAFNPDFSEYSRQYQAIAEAVYRECSEFVHGNASTHNKLPSSITFDKDIFDSWCEKAKTIRLIIIFVFSSRYLNHISPTTYHIIEPVLLDAIGHLSAVQSNFNKPLEEK